MVQVRIRFEQDSLSLTRCIPELLYVYSEIAVKLDQIAAGVLYLLWRRRRHNDGSLVSAKVLLTELQEGQAQVVFIGQLHVTTVKKTLRKLRKEGMVELGDSQKSKPEPGPAPNGYRLSADAPIITWRATAAIVMLLHNHEEQRLKRKTIVEEATKLGLTHHHREDRLNSQELSNLIDWCLRKEYFKEEKVKIDEISAPRTEKRLMTTSKVDDHGLFLKILAADVKRQVASDHSASAAAASESGGLQKQG